MTMVLAIAHSPAGAARASQLLGADATVHTPPSGWRGMVAAARWVLLSRSKALYLVDLGMSTAVAAVLGRLLQRRVVLDTGDAVHALARSLGDRTPLGLALVAIGEQLALRSASCVIVRGLAHAERVPARAAVHIPDLAPPTARPVPAAHLRAGLGLERAFVVGLVGNLILSPRLRISYGWDLIEALPHTAPEVAALVVGDGSGLEQLRARAHTLGVQERCRFVGRVDEGAVSEYVSAMDVGISTQTNDAVGQVRTTAKLPLYLACGCPVLASHVGEAARLLGPLGWTLRYDGVLDAAYPRRLAAAIESWRADASGQAARRLVARRLAMEAFDPETLRTRLAAALSGDGRRSAAESREKSDRRQSCS